MNLSFLGVHQDLLLQKKELVMAEILDKQMLKALSTDTRQDIIKLLLKRPYTASELSKLLEKHVTTIAEHLNVLEKSSLITKKDSTNKWIYYTLTEKGEKLFKTSYYSWVVVFSLSVVFMFTGFLRILTTQSMLSESKELTMVASSADAQTSFRGTQQITSFDATGILLILIAILGFAFIGYRHWKRNEMLKNATMYVERAML